MRWVLHTICNVQLGDITDDMLTFLKFVSSVKRFLSLGRGSNLQPCNDQLFLFFRSILGLHLTWDNKCVSFCPEGTFYDETEKICKRCISSCRACHREDYCIDCVRQKFLYNHNSCKTSCYGKHPYKRSGAEGIRLFGGKRASMGFVEVFHNGSWATICGTNWDIKDAAVVCRELGYGDGVKANANYPSASDRSRAVLNPIHCKGTEFKISQCSQGTSKPLSFGLS